MRLGLTSWELHGRELQEPGKPGIGGKSSLIDAVINIANDWKGQVPKGTEDVQAPFRSGTGSDTVCASDEGVNGYKIRWRVLPFAVPRYENDQMHEPLCKSLIAFQRHLRELLEVIAHDRQANRSAK